LLSKPKEESSLHCIDIKADHYKYSNLAKTKCRRKNRFGNRKDEYNSKKKIKIKRKLKKLFFLNVSKWKKRKRGKYKNVL